MNSLFSRIARINLRFGFVFALALASISKAGPALAVEFPQAKIAIVDIQSVLDHSVAVTHLREAIDEVSEKFSKELSTKETEFKQKEAELVKRRETLKPEQFDKEVESFYKKLSTFQHDAQKKKEKLERAHAEAIDLVHGNTIKIVAELAKEKGFNLALPMSQTLYSTDSLNITPEVTYRLNQKVTKVQLKF